MPNIFTKSRRFCALVLGVFVFCGFLRGGQRVQGAFANNAWQETVSVAFPSGSDTILRRYASEHQGALTPVSRARLSQPSLSVEPSGRYAYATRINAAQNAYEILQYRIAPDGTPQALAPAVVAFGGKPPSNQWIGSISTDLNPIVFEPKRSNVYVISSEGIWQFHMNRNGTLRVLASTPAKTGEAKVRPANLKELTPPGEKSRSYRNESGNYLQPQSLAFDASHRFAYALSREHYDQNDWTDIPNWAVQGSTRSVEVACWLTKFSVAHDGTLKMAQKPILLPQGSYKLVLSPKTSVACIVNRGANRVTLYSLPRGASEAITPGATLRGQAAAFDSSGRFLYVANDYNFDQYRVAPDGSCTPLAKSLALTASFDARSRMQHPGRIMGSVGSPLRVERIEISPSGRRLYFIMSALEGTFLCAYRIAGSGTLAPLPGAAVPVGYGYGVTLAVSSGAPLPPARPLPSAIKLKPIGSEFLYALNFEDNTVSQYAIMPRGLLAPLTPPTVALKSPIPTDMAAHPSGRYLYVSSFVNSAISQFSIGADGTLAPLDPPTVSYGDNPAQLLIEKTGRFLYAVDGNRAEISVWRINANGTLTQDAEKTVFVGYGNGPASLSPAGLLHVINDNVKASAYALQPDGALKLLSKTQMNLSKRYTYDPTGRYAFYGNENDRNAVGQLSVQPDGALVERKPRTVVSEEQPEDIAIDAAGRFAYVANKGAFAGDGSITQFVVGGDGLIAPSGAPPVFTGTQPFRVVIDPSGQFIYALSLGIDRNLHELNQPGSISSIVIGPDGMLRAVPDQKVRTGSRPITMVAVRRDK